MMSARSIFAIACSFLALTVFACAKGSTGGAGGSGGEGGDDWGGQGPGPSSSSSGSGGTGGGTGGTGGTGGGGNNTVCDTTSADCSTCSTCSRETADGLCNAEFAACIDSLDCNDFLTCVQGCPDNDDVCYTSCESSYPTGAAIFNDYASCVICGDCYVRCDGANACSAP